MQSRFPAKFTSGSSLLFLLEGLMAISSQMPCQAYTTVSAFTPNNIATGSSIATTTGAGGNSGGYDPVDNFTLNYAGNLKTLKNFTAGSTLYTVLPLTYTVNLIRNAALQENNILWQTYSSFTTTTPVPAVPSTQNFTVNLPGTNVTNMETAFGSGSLDAGTDNLFVNVADANGNNNNIERLDVYYSTGLTSSSDLAFPIFERGTTTGHDAFKIAAILTTDAGGNPTSYGPLVSVGSGWGSTSLATSDVFVLRNLSSDPAGDAEFVSARVSQTLGGTSIMALSDLGVSAGTTFYGYSLFSSDVTATHNLLAPSTFPNNTGQSTGGLDVVGSFQAFRVVPEPASTSLALAAFGLATYRRRRQALRR